MNSVINDTMTSKEMLDILVAKNMEDAREEKKEGRAGMLVKLNCAL